MDPHSARGRVTGRSETASLNDSLGGPPDHAQIAIILVSLASSGTERRMAFVFENLASRYPGRFLLVVNRSLYDRLRSAGFRLGTAADVHVMEGHSALDRKRRAGASLPVNLGRLATLLRYRQEIAEIVRLREIRAIQVFLEMVPVIGLWPIPGVRRVASLVSHHPQYYDGRSLSCRLLLRSLKTYDRVDALYAFIRQKLLALGVPEERVAAPAWNCVDHVRFHPEPKEDIVTFTGRALAFKHPELMIDAIGHVRSHVGDVRFYVLGEGPMVGRLKRQAARRGLLGQVEIQFMADPSSLVNRSRVHVCVEEYDNVTNQSLLEGMASGCAVVASDVGLTRSVVTPDVGLLVPLEAGAIGEAILRLIRNPPECTLMGEAARTRILRLHNVRAYLDYLLSLYNSVASEP